MKSFILIAIGAVIILLMYGQGQKEAMVGSYAVFSQFGLSWTCNANINSNYNETGDSDLSDYTMHLEGNGQTLDVNIVPTLTSISTALFSPSGMSDSYVTCTAPFDFSHVQSLDIATIGSMTGQSSVNVMHLQLTGDISDTTFTKVNSTWTVTNGAESTTITAPSFYFDVHSTTCSSGDVSCNNASSSLTITSVNVICETGYEYNSAGACVAIAEEPSGLYGDLDNNGVISRTELSAAITNWYLGTATKTQLAETIMHWAS